MDVWMDGAGHPPNCVLSLRSGWASCLTRVMFPPAGSAHAPALAPAPALAHALALDGVAHFCSCWPLLDDGVRPLNFSLTLLGCVAASGASAMMDGWMDVWMDGAGHPPNCVLSLRSGWASCLTRVMFPPAGSAHAPALAPAPALAHALALDGVAHFCSCWPLLDDGVRPLNFSLTLLG